MKKLPLVLVGILCCIVGLKASYPELFHTIHADNRLELDIAAGDMLQLREMLTEFASNNGLLIHDYGAKMPPHNGRSVFWLRLVDAKFLRIDVLNIQRENLIYIWIYRLEPHRDVEAVIGGLEQALRYRWPNVRPSVDQPPIADAGTLGVHLPRD